MHQVVARFHLSIVILLFALSLSSCAYKAGIRERSLPGGYELISVPMFKNQTHEVGSEVFFTNALIQEIERAKLAQVVPEPKAQVVLLGSVTSVSFNKTGSETRGAIVVNLDYRVLVSIYLQLKRVSDGKILWDGNFQGERSYSAPKITVDGLSSANAIYNHSAHTLKIQSLARDMMSEAHDRLTENF